METNSTNAGGAAMLRTWQLKVEHNPNGGARWKGVYDDTGETVPDTEGEWRPKRIDHEALAKLRAQTARCIEEGRRRREQTTAAPRPKRLPTAGDGVLYLIANLVALDPRAAGLDPICDFAALAPLEREAQARVLALLERDGYQPTPASPEEPFSTPLDVPLSTYPALERAVQEMDAAARRRSAQPSAGARGTSAASPSSRPWELAANVKPEHVTWLWRGRIPFGKVTLLDGDPGQGKSTIGLDLAARLTTGRAMPGETDGHFPAGAVVISFEDSAADTIRPRLEAAGADLSRVAIFRVDRAPSLPEDLPLIEQAIRETGARFVLLDPLMAALTGRVDSHRDQDIRRALRPLTVLAERTGAAILVIRHLNKNSGKGTSAIYRGGGSIGITGAARAVLVAGYDPEALEDTSRHVLAPVKMNLCAMPPTLKYATAAVQLEGGYETMKIEWAGESAVTADALLAQPSTKEGRNKVKEVVEFLTTMLADRARPAREVEHELRDMGFSPWAIRAARKRLGIVSEHEGGEQGGGRWMWSLPTETTVKDGEMEVRVRG